MKTYNWWPLKKRRFLAVFLGGTIFLSFDLPAAPFRPVPPPLPAFKITTKAPLVKPSVEPAYRELIPLKIQSQNPDGFDLVIQNKLDLKMAAYRRGSNLYVFFDKDVLFNFKEIEGLIKNFIQSIEQVTLAKGSLLKIALMKGAMLSTKREGYGWILTFSKNSQVSSSIPLFEAKVQEPKSLDSSITFNALNLGNFLIYQDPLVHDTLILIPTHDVLQSKEMNFPEFKFIQTIQGLAISTFSKDLKVQQTENSFTLNTSPGLNLSSSQDRHMIRTLAQAPSLFHFDPKTNNFNQFYDQERGLFDTIIRAQGAEKAKARLRAVKFYLSHWMPQEALGLLKLIQQDTPQEAEKSDVLAHKALAQGLAGHDAFAQKTFFKSGLKDDPEIKLWQGMFDLDQEDHEQGLKNVVENLSLAQAYPSEIQNHIYLKAAEASLDAHKPAQFMIDKVKKAVLSPQENEEFSYVQALSLKESNNPSQAIDGFQKLTQSPHLRIRTLAAYQLSLMWQETNPNLTTLIQLLEEHRGNWRGDATEVKILKHLADLYFKNDQVPEGIRILKQLIMYYPETTAAKEAKATVESVIYKHLTDNKRLSAFQRLTFYTEFQKYFPQDNRKDKIFQTLGESYLDLNLVDKAENIFLNLLPVYKQDLEVQGHLLLKLAQAQLKENKLEKAYDTLKSMDVLDIKDPETLIHQKQIQAKILTQRKDYDGALALLENISSQEALYQKTDIAMAAKNWPKVIQNLEILIAMKEQKGDLTPDIILNLATAYYHSEQATKLKDLRQKYLSFMLKSPLAATFSLITETHEAAKTTPEDLTQQLQNTKEFDQQLKNYLKSVKPAS
ncbi:MAG: tetratricopeptide repeat protein [Janthinobacterium lividum]